MAKTIKGITVEIGGDTTKLGKALKNVESQAKSLQSELKGVNTLLKGDPGNTTLLTQKQQLLTKAVHETSEKLKILKGTQEQVQAQFDKGEITEEQFRDFQREIVATEQKLKSLNKELDNFGSVGAQKVAAAGEKVQEVGGKVEAVGKKFMVASTVATGALVGVTKEAIDFETAWTGVTKTVDGTDEQLEKIRQGLLDLSQETASSAEEIAAVAEAAGQLGIKTENILDFTKTMVMLGDTTNLSADEAATALAKFANITGMSADNYGKLGSVIVDLGNNFATTEADIVAMATRLASTGEVTGLSEAQIMALAAALSSAGIEAEAGGSAMAKLLKMLYSTNAEFNTASQAVNATGYSLRELQLMQSNSSSEFKDLAASMGLTKTELGGYLETVAQMNNYASTAGVSVEEFRKAYAEDAVGALSMFITGLNETERNGKSAVEILNEMGLTEVRLSNAVLSMASSGDLMTNAIQTANNAWGENSALTAEAEKRYATTASKIEQLKNTVTELCVNLGSVLLPIVQSVVEKLKGFADWLTQLSPAAQKVVLAVLAIVAALGPALIIIGKLISAVGQIMMFAPQMVTMFNTIKTAVSGLFSLIAAHPVVAVIVAIIAAVVLLYNKCEWFRNGVNAALEWIKNAFQTFVAFLSTLPERVGSFFTNLVTRVTTWASNMASKAKQAGSRFVAGVVDFFQNLPERVGYFLGYVIGRVASWVVNMTIKARQAGQQFIQNVVTFFQQLPGRLSAFLLNAASNVASWAVNMASRARQAGSQFLQNVVSFFQQLPGRIWTFLSNAVAKVASWGTQMVAKGKSAAKSLMDTVVNTVKQIPGKMLSIGKDIVKGLWDGIKNAKDWLKDKVTGFVDGIISGFKDGFKIGSPSKVMAWQGEMLDEGLAQGMEKNADSPMAAMQRVTNGILGAADMQSRALNMTNARSTSAAPSGTADNSSLASKLDGIYERLGRLQIVLDTGTLVGETIEKIDSSLATRQLLNARGV